MILCCTSKKTGVEPLFDFHVVPDGLPHVVDDVCFQLLERNILQNVVKLVQRLEDLVLVAFYHCLVVHQPLDPWKREGADTVHVIQVDAVDDVGRLGVAQDVEDVRKGDEGANGEQDVGVEHPA